MPSQNCQKFIFIDTNIYRDIFVNPIFGNKILPILEKLSNDGYCILMTQQILDEINRNRFSNWSKDDSKNIDDLTKIKDAVNNKIVEELKSRKNFIHQIDLKIKKITKNQILLQQRLISPKGGSSKLLNKILKIVKIIPDSIDVLTKVQLRTAKGNPPFDKNTGEKRCDSYIWESLVSHFENSTTTSPLLYLFTRNYSDWCVTHSGKRKINQFLIEEFRQRTKGKLNWSDDLKDLPNISSTEKRIVKEEEKKLSVNQRMEKIEQKLPEALRLSNSWENSDKLMKYVKNDIPGFSENIIVEILKASLDNKDLSSGPYNQVIDASEAFVFFISLYIRSKKLGMSGDIWKSFYLKLDEDQQKKLYAIREDLQKNGIKFNVEEIKYITPDDIPF